MKAFAALFRELDTSTATRDKRAALVNYFSHTPPRDAVWALFLLSGGKITGAKRKIASTTELRSWISEASELPDWLVSASYDQVGDLAETLALLISDKTLSFSTEDDQRSKSRTDNRSLSDWIENHLLPVANQPEALRKAVIVSAWFHLPYEQRLLFNKLLTGALRVGVSQRLVQQALAELSGIDIALLAQRMLGEWQPSEAFFSRLLSQEALPEDRQQPYPFFLASPLENAPESLGDCSDWLMEWKWDGIRLQLIKRDGEIALWSRGEERLDGRFPELETAALSLPQDCVLDGELVIWKNDAPQPEPFTLLQTRIQRRKPGAKTLTNAPAQLLIYDLLEYEGEDYRPRAHSERRGLLEQLLAQPGIDSRLRASPLLTPDTWQEAAELREQSREMGTEGLMLKRASAPYQSGRRRGDWWKWKVNPLTIDAVLLYAQAGHGRRSTLYTDYTFGLWRDDELVPIAKAYSGLTDKEILALDRWIRSNTLERFGPVRSVAAGQVFELAFEAVNISRRHKSGIAVRFPRILRWRQDKPVNEADQLATLQALAR